MGEPVEGRAESTGAGRVPMPAPDIVICVRRTLDWEDATLVEARLDARFRPKARMWNATFDPPYHELRYRLKQIAQLNLSRVRNATCLTPGAIPPGALVVPVDDDDWLSPTLADELRDQSDPTTVGYLWTRHVIGVPPPLPRRLWYGLWGWKASTCGSNNYAVVYRPELASVVSSHRQAGAYFDRSRRHVRRVPRRWSIQNRNMGSQTAMGWRRPTVTRDELVASFRRYRRLYAALDLPAELGWARPYVNLMEELMAQISVK